MTQRTYSADEFSKAAKYEEAWARRADAKWDAEMVAEQHRLYAAALRIAARVMEPGVIEQALAFEIEHYRGLEPSGMAGVLRDALTKDTSP